MSSQVLLYSSCSSAGMYVICYFWLWLVHHKWILDRSLCTCYSTHDISIENPNPLVVKPQLHIPEPTLLVIIEQTEHLELGLVGIVQQTIWCGLP
jgi:hypothetical protein